MSITPLADQRIVATPSKAAAIKEFQPAMKGLIERGLQAIQNIEGPIQQTMRDIVRLEGEMQQLQTAHEARLKLLNDQIAGFEAKIAEIEAFIRDEVEKRETFFNGVGFKEFYDSYLKVFTKFAGTHQHPGYASDGRHFRTTNFTSMNH